MVEGKRKAAKNENEFIYHETVPALDDLQEVKGASLVKGIPFSTNDVEVWKFYSCIFTLLANCTILIRYQVRIFLHV